MTLGNEFTDTYGKIVKVDDFVAVSDNGRIVAGIVTDTNRNGYAISVRTNQHEDIVLGWSHKVMIIDDKLKDRVMIEKLEMP